ncbi:MAG: single-stranded DNA-binding protein [Pseudonocardiaceae bacterium]
MAGVAEVTLVGILVTDPELRTTPTGDAIATFTVAANDGHHDPDTGQWADQGTTFLRCSIEHHTAENVAESLTTGARVLVTGVLRQREWNTTDGDKRYAYELDATEIGASLTWATVKITKTTRDTTKNSARRRSRERRVTRIVGGWQRQPRGASGCGTWPASGWERSSAPGYPATTPTAASVRTRADSPRSELGVGRVVRSG